MKMEEGGPGALGSDSLIVLLRKQRNKKNGLMRLKTEQKSVTIN